MFSFASCCACDPHQEQEIVAPHVQSSTVLKDPSSTSPRSLTSLNHSPELSGGVTSPYNMASSSVVNGGVGCEEMNRGVGCEENVDPEEEKKLIQEAVRGFIKAAVSGIRCAIVHLTDSTSPHTSNAHSRQTPRTTSGLEMNEAKFTINKSCRNYSLLVDGSVVTEKKVSDVRQCLSFEDLQGGLLTDPKLASCLFELNSEQRSCLAILEHESTSPPTSPSLSTHPSSPPSLPSTHPARHLVLMLPTSADREVFTVAMSVLSLYAKGA